MAKDPYRYFRVEARELLDGLTRGVLEFEKGAAGEGEGVRARLLRLAHTLKGASRVVKQVEIAEMAHAVEDVLGEGPPPAGDARPSRADRLLGLLDAMGAKVAALGQAEGEAGQAPIASPSTAEAQRVATAPAEEPIETVRIAIGEMDALLKGISQAAVQVTAIRSDIAPLDHLRRVAGALLEHFAPGGRADRAGAADRPRALAAELNAALDRLDRAVTNGVDQAEQEIAGVRDLASRLRLLPAGVLFGPLERAVRDAAASTGTLAAFETSGGDVRLDAHVLAALRDALLHVVRNAVAHAGEPEAVRRATGKPAALQVTLSIERRGDRVAFLCADDGRGIDLAAVKRAAVARGIVNATEAEAMSDGEATHLVLRRGLTTAGAVTDVSGRGIGLDVARETVARLEGEVTIRSALGRGTTLELCVPVSLSSLAALFVETGGVVAAIPLDAVKRAMLVSAGEVARSPQGDALLYEGRLVPLLPLAQALHSGGPPGATAPDERGSASRSAVVVEAAGAIAAVEVGRIRGVATVVMRPLPRLAAGGAIVAGAALDAQGNADLVLDPAALVRAASAPRGHAAPRPVAPRFPVLVIDDSLTTRMLEQSILESAGYEVELATSAEEALAMARQKRYGLFVVDVEMPGMDGFEFVALTRADAALRETHAVLVTSRGSPEDRHRGEKAGAQAYIVKGEFDQSHLLSAVGRLIAQA